MIVFVVAVVAGALAGALAGGRPGNLAGLSWRRPWLVWVALGAQLVPAVLPDRWRGPVGAAVALGGAGVLVWWVTLQHRAPRGVRVGLWVAVAGLGLNAAVMAPNGGMPVSATALEDAGFPPGTDVTDGNLYKHVPADDDTVLAPLGDVIGLRVGPFAEVLSPGDLVLAVGLAMVVAAGMTGAPAGVDRSRESV